jgi:universal stress protein A
MLIKTILVGTDFSEHSQRAFERACDLAAQLGAKVFLLHVQTAGALRTAVKEGLLDGASTDEELEAAVSDLIERRFAQMLSQNDPSRVSVEKVLRRGEAAPAIVAYATEIAADLVVLGRRGTGLLEDVRAAVIGSVAESLVRRAPCPVMIVRRDHK